ncbi:hypothetical protein QEJ31_08720 [Pigmentibacter sp. JX0631]|uniref:hypothetical protein n=1 Tax=Pigmentibacter sp. JX0631 TaxID=2976982 RepID=UPI002469C342|nr:hypothetical protein [Pigmentibacter sp. JX0631]WGL58617.1 hypothetical protein QEJ31_08720 [Pigmentibacter sp. JX0631]
MSSETIYDELRFLQTNRSFLGREFLTWLWFKTETQNHKLNIGNFGSFHLYIDDKIVLSSSNGSVRENSLKGGTPAYAFEAGSALGTGKLVHEAKFILQDSQRQWSFSLVGEDLSLRNVRLPVISEADSQAHITQRVLSIQLLANIIDELFKQFMEIRISQKLEAELTEIRNWVENKVTI